MDPATLRLGNIPDRFDGRDRPLFAENHFQSASASASQSTAGSGTPVVLPNLPPVYDQLQIGSCVANAVCAALRYVHNKTTGTAYKDFDPSRLFVYYNARTTEDLDKINEVQSHSDGKADTGTQNRNAIHSLLVQGVCKEDLWPYGNPSSDQNTHIFDNLNKKPNPVEPVDLSTALAQARGSHHRNDPSSMGQPDLIPRSISYYRIFNPAAVKGNASQTPPPGWRIDWNTVPVALLEKTIQDGFPIVFGSRLYKDADFRFHVKNGVMAKPPTSDSDDVGGHAMIIVGFDSTKRLFLIQNSWGTAWPEGVTDQSVKGRFWLPYEWFELNVNGFPCTYDYWVIKTSK